MRQNRLARWMRCGHPSLSEVINPIRYEDPEWDAHHRDLEGYSVDKHVFRHTGGEVYRKGWEWTQCIFGLQKLGMIRSNAKALGVGAGHEPVIFWLADRIGLVTATDLYGNETWSKNSWSRGCCRPANKPRAVLPPHNHEEQDNF